jgi:putative DNA primase/helicase
MSAAVIARALDSLAGEPRWVAWRNEQRGKKTTKVPYAAHGFGKAKADDPWTWGTRDNAEEAAARVVNGQGGGIGIELGDLGEDTFLGGLDLDSCLGEDGALASWAQVILDVVPSYAEISPSGRGLKLFFYCATEDIRPFLDRIGAAAEQWGVRRDVPGEDARDHGPAVEIYFSHRYFAVTGARWGTAPDALLTLDHEALERLAPHIPAPRTPKTDTEGGSAGGDNSRSAKALAKGCEFCRQHPDCTFKDMAAALRADPEIAGWCREKGDPSGSRELRRIWEKAQAAKHSSDPEISRLAALPALEYDQQREAAAERLRCRKSTLDNLVEIERGKSVDLNAAPMPGRKLSLPDPEPWADPVVGATLLDDITREIKRYVILSETEASAAALWVIAAHAFDSFVIFPRLFIRAAEKGCGKTTTLEVITPLVPRPLNASSITAAAMYRVIEQARPTLLLDEADTFAKDDEDLRGVLNAGHRRDGVVLRCVETREGYEVRQFSVWAPAALAAIGHLPATIEDRCIIISLRRKLPDEVVSSLRLDRVGRLERLAREAARWAADNADALAAADPEIPDGIVNRQADNWRPLIAVADLAGGRWPAQARNVATEMCRAGGGVKSIRELLLEDLRDLFNREIPDESYGTRFSAEIFAKKPSALFTDEILKGLHERDDRPWPEFRDGSPITSKQLAGLLRPLGVKVGRTVRRGDKTSKGYKREWLEDAFARYVTPISVTPCEL